LAEKLLADSFSEVLIRNEMVLNDEPLSSER
jgi:hypothetical protein